MTADYYATLGVAPTTEDVVIRAAYLALMRRYHPDTNASPTAAARARAITAAYEVLSDRDRRADYDRRRADQSGLGPPRPPLKQFPVGPIVFTAIMLLLVPLLFMAIRSPRTAPAQPDRLANASEATSVGTGGGITLPNEPPIKRPIATLKQTPSPADDPTDVPEVADLARAPAQPRLDTPPVLSKPPPPRRPLPRPEARVDPKPTNLTAQPSCRFGNSGGETPTCSDSNLAALDRHVTLLYNQSLRYGDAAKRATLMRTRDHFLVRRGECRSDSCLRAAYLDRMREVTDIMTGQPQPAR